MDTAVRVVVAMVEVPDLGVRLDDKISVGLIRVSGVVIMVPVRYIHFIRFRIAIVLLHRGNSRVDSICFRTGIVRTVRETVQIVRHGVVDYFSNG